MFNFSEKKKKKVSHRLFILINSIGKVSCYRIRDLIRPYLHQKSTDILV